MNGILFSGTNVHTISSGVRLTHCVSSGCKKGALFLHSNFSDVSGFDCCVRVCVDLNGFYVRNVFLSTFSHHKLESKRIESSRIQNNSKFGGKTILRIESTT